MKWGRENNRSNDYFVEFVKSRNLRWNIPWWSIPSFSETCSSNPSKGLFLCGLKSSVTLYPLRVQRQIGLAQRIAIEDCIVQKSIELDNRQIEEWAKSWALRSFISIPEKIESRSVSKAYVAWTVCLDSKERDRLRVEEKLDYDLCNLIFQKE